MSGKVTGWLLRRGPSTQTDRLIVLAIGDAADNEGRHAHIGRELIAAAALVSPGHVGDRLRVLRADRWVAITMKPAPGRVTEWELPRYIERELAGDEAGGELRGSRAAQSAEVESAGLEPRSSRPEHANGAGTARVLRGSRPAPGTGTGTRARQSSLRARVRAVEKLAEADVDRIVDKIAHLDPELVIDELDDQCAGYPELRAYALDRYLAHPDRRRPDLPIDKLFDRDRPDPDPPEPRGPQ